MTTTTPACTSHKDYLDLLAKLIKELCKDIFDYGCGVGAMLSMICKEHPEKNYMGIDLSTKMIEVVNRRKKAI